MNTVDDRQQRSERSRETQTKAIVKGVKQIICRNPLCKQKNHGLRNKNPTKNHVTHNKKTPGLYAYRRSTDQK